MAHLKPDPELYLAPDKVSRVEQVATIIFMALVLAVGIVLGG